MRPVALFLLVAGIGAALTGCASTTVKKDPGPHDRGIRYYRPKPYLFLEPSVPTKDGGFIPGEMVSISLKWMPDFSEEYSIHIKTGLGTNKTTVKLEDGWNLTDLNVEIDSKVADNVNALANLIDKAKPSIVPTGGNPGTPQPTPSKLAVRATNVPMGFYEAVLGAGPDGKKQLYGWRYIGFAPYAQCPLQMGGGACVGCETAPLYGLVFVDGIMTFKPLTAAAAPDQGHTFVPIPQAVAQPGQPGEGEEDARVQKLKELLFKGKPADGKPSLGNVLGASLDATSIGVGAPANKIFKVTVTVSVAERTAFLAKYNNSQVEAEAALNKNADFAGYVKEAVGTADYFLDFKLAVRGKN